MKRAKKVAAKRKSGRPPLPDDQRKRAIEVTLSTETIERARQIGGGGPRDVSKGLEIAIKGFTSG